jgi:hypothetical protein
MTEREYYHGDEYADRLLESDLVDHDPYDKYNYTDYEDANSNTDWNDVEDWYNDER